MLKVVIDTNVIISAVAFGGKPAAIIKLARTKQIELFISKAILDEISKVLERKFHWSKTEIKALQSFMRKHTQLTQPKEKLNIIKTDESDNRILECAKEAKADCIVSGDTRDVQPLKRYGKIKIVSPAEFLLLWESGNIVEKK